MHAEKFILSEIYKKLTGWSSSIVDINLSNKNLNGNKKGSDCEVFECLTKKIKYSLLMALGFLGSLK